MNIYLFFHLFLIFFLEKHERIVHSSPAGFTVVVGPSLDSMRRDSAVDQGRNKKVVRRSCGSFKEGVNKQTSQTFENKF